MADKSVYTPVDPAGAAYYGDGRQFTDCWTYPREKIDEMVGTSLDGIETAKQDAIAAVQEAGSDAVQEIEAKGEETLESIPDDYTQLSEDVSELKSDLNSVENGKAVENIVTTPTLTVNTAINSTNGEYTTGMANTFASTDYIDITGAVSIVHTFFGYGNYGFAFYDATKEYISGTKNVMTITDIPSNAVYIRFTDYVANGTHASKTVTITKEYPLVKAINELIGASGQKYAHFSFDDCIFWDDITQNASTYDSIFDNAFLSNLKTLHDNYGVKCTLLCFIVNGTASISDVTDKFASEFSANKDWLKFGFHGTTPSETFPTADPATVAGYYNTFVTAIYKMTGDYDCIDRVIRTSSFSGSKNVCLALRNCNCGIRGFLCNDGSGGSYYHGADVNAYINANCKYFDAETQLTFIHSISRLEGSGITTSILETLEYQNHLPIYEFFSHQDQFSTGVITKMGQIANWLNTHGFTHDFTEYALNL